MSQPPNEAGPSSTSKARCTEQECDRASIARGLCPKHYQQRWRIAELPLTKARQTPMVYLRVTLTREQVVALRREAVRRELRLTKLVRDLISLSVEHLAKQT